MTGLTTMVMVLNCFDTLQTQIKAIFISSMTGLVPHHIIMMLKPTIASTITKRVPVEDVLHGYFSIDKHIEH